MTDVAACKAACCAVSQQKRCRFALWAVQAMYIETAQHAKQVSSVTRPLHTRQAMWQQGVQCVCRSIVVACSRFAEGSVAQRMLCTMGFYVSGGLSGAGKATCQMPRVLGLPARLCQALFEAQCSDAGTCSSGLSYQV
jgi:hypothetical protein